MQTYLIFFLPIMLCKLTIQIGHKTKLCIVIDWFPCRSVSQRQLMGSTLTWERRRTRSAQLHLKRRPPWQKWRWTDPWSYIFSCRQRGWTADTTEPAVSSPSSVVTPSTAGSSPHISGSTLTPLPLQFVSIIPKDLDMSTLIVVSPRRRLTHSRCHHLLSRLCDVHMRCRRASKGLCERGWC